MLDSLGLIRRKLSICLTACLVGAAISASPCRADIIYGNLAPAGGTAVLAPFVYPDNASTPDPYFTFGDHVAFGPGGRTLKSVRARFYLYPAYSPDPGQPMTTDVRFLIYEDDGGTVGSLLGTSSIFGQTFASSSFTTVTFPNMSIRVGDSAFIALVTTNVVRPSPYGGYELLGPSATAAGIPNPGYSDSFSALKAYGYGFAAGSTPFDLYGSDSPAQNIRIEISAIPEPRFALIWFALLLGLPFLLRCCKGVRLNAHSTQIQ